MQKIIVGMMFVVIILLAMILRSVGSKKNKVYFQNQSFNLVLTALFVAVDIVLARFQVYIPLFGFPSLRFSVSGTPIFFVGAFFGPLYGGAAGFACDIINFMLAPAGPFHMGFTLNSMLVGIIPGVFFYLIRTEKIPNSFVKLNKILGIIALVGALIYINFIGIKELDELLMFGAIPVNIVLSILFIMLVAGLGFVVYKLKQVYQGDKGLYSIEQLIFIKCISFIVIQLILTPIWLFQMYNIPIVASVTVRILKSLIDVPLQVMIIYTIIHAIPVRMREKLI